MSNYTDFNVFEHIEGLELSYISPDQDLEAFDGQNGKVGPDLLIIPGSKNTLGDMERLNKSPMRDQILAYSKRGGLIVGLCGGYQMLGQTIRDDRGLDGSRGKVDGLGLLEVDTVFGSDKITGQVRWNFGHEEGYFFGLENSQIEGYETHLGRTYPGPDDNYKIKNGHIMGTYCHGIFDSAGFLSGLLNNIAKARGLARAFEVKDYRAIKNEEYNKLADLIRENVDMEKVYNIIFSRDI